MLNTDSWNLLCANKWGLTRLKMKLPTNDSLSNYIHTHTHIYIYIYTTCIG